MKQIKKFFVSRGTIWLLVLVVFLCIVLYGICSYNVNSSDVRDVKTIFFQTAKDVLLVIASISGVNLFSNLLIEVRNKNALVTDIMVNDVFSAPEFYDKMDSGNKIRMYNALERSLFLNMMLLRKCMKVSEKN